jgi:hypothetical protein
MSPKINQIVRRNFFIKEIHLAWSRRTYRETSMSRDQLFLWSLLWRVSLTKRHLGTGSDRRWSMVRSNSARLSSSINHDFAVPTQKSIGIRDHRKPRKSFMVFCDLGRYWWKLCFLEYLNIVYYQSIPLAKKPKVSRFCSEYWCEWIL